MAMASSSVTFKSKSAAKSNSDVLEATKRKNCNKIQEQKILDKQINHVKFQTSSVPLSKASKACSSKSLNSQHCISHKSGTGINQNNADVDSVKHAVSNGKPSSSNNGTPKSRPRSSIAASYLAKTADGLAKTPKRSHNFDKNQTLKPDNGHPPGRNLQENSPKKHTLLSTSPKKKPAAEKGMSLYKSSCRLNAGDTNLIVSSPTVAKIPCDIVRQRVDIIQVRSIDVLPFLLVCACLFQSSLTMIRKITL